MPLNEAERIAQTLADFKELALLVSKFGKEKELNPEYVIHLLQAVTVELSTFRKEFIANNN